VREYVARGIPVYALDLNVAILNRLLAAPRIDALARNPKKPDFRMVAGKTLLGTGPNRIEIYPLRGETSERQMMVYFPEHKLLYGSDPFQKNEQGHTFPQTVWELVHAVEREKLSVDTFFMMHIGPTPWGDLRRNSHDSQVEISGTSLTEARPCQRHRRAHPSTRLRFVRAARKG
jgi:hypothetical protein